MDAGQWPFGQWHAVGAADRVEREALMAVNLNEPLAWKPATGDAAAMLDQLQPNILKAHVRRHLSVLLLRFDDPPQAREFLKRLVTLMKSARAHLEEIDAYKTGSGHGTPYVGVGLSHEGYGALGIPAARTPTDAAFVRGMRDPATVERLSDPDVADWEAPYRSRIDAIVLVGDQSEDSVQARCDEIEALKPDSVNVVGRETGLGLYNDDDDGIEHFGYVDGRSQPLFLVEDIEAERRTTDGVTVWDPAAPLARVIVPDPGAPDPATQFGSYLVFRKIEQNVRRFKEEEEAFAERLGLQGDDSERAGAMLVGRFEDGTPLTLQGDEGAHHPVMNDFTYASDDEGLKCPIYAHIRTVNSRGPAAADRLHVMARRGQTYGERDDDINDPKVAVEMRPEHGVGLLFMAFNADIAEQFEYTQATLANGAGDPIIGQGARGAMKGPTRWGEPGLTETDPVAQTVVMKGGEYFFMPSLACLESLPEREIAAQVDERA
jgi:Dyp-type peroxidase family